MGKQFLPAVLGGRRSSISPWRGGWAAAPRLWSLAVVTQCGHWLWSLAVASPGGALPAPAQGHPQCSGSLHWQLHTHTRHVSRAGREINSFICSYPCKAALKFHPKAVHDTMPWWTPMLFRMVTSKAFGSGKDTQKLLSEEFFFKKGPLKLTY